MIAHLHFPALLPAPRSRGFTLALPLLLGLGFSSPAAPVARGQGDLAPAHPPERPQLKTLEQAEPGTPIPSNRPGLGSFPYVITEPGLYYLTRDLTGDPSVAPCIEVSAEAPHTTIDLRGFTIRATGDNPASTHAAIQGASGVRNGRILGPWREGASGQRLLDLHVEGAVELGLRLHGLPVGGLLRGCTVHMGAPGGSVGVQGVGKGLILEDLRVRDGRVVLPDVTRLCRAEVVAGNSAGPLVEAGHFAHLRDVRGRPRGRAGDAAPRRG